ncbi:hypothetical protein [Pseudovibrio brasiliensis]|uniref:Uncharacterized protein n=1 Tax=Pseudovibrio brasiliensis TaxID=1898042 RepID=A0ABX8AVI3_9HYPH|nr:hypothetical protein [Pseudovibrio brasiliensis]QUS59075.1 hypothetical protein KGB56_26020 [Pseudovibrio brasiliensis]
MSATILTFPTKQNTMRRKDVISFSETLEAAWDASLEATNVFVEENGDYFSEGGAYVVFDDLNAPFVRLLKVKGVGEAMISGGWKVSLLLGLPYKSSCVYEAGCNAFVDELKLRKISARVVTYEDGEE